MDPPWESFFNVIELNGFFRDLNSYKICKKYLTILLHLSYQLDCLGKRRVDSRIVNAAPPQELFFLFRAFERTIFHCSKLKGQIWLLNNS